ncbi:DNA repair protein RecN [Paenibacillus sp. IB182496]|uniref:DNA repair protein RecN n=1 Tax=Paenibacillus sabuli TaxID=2772509 RepID=A0A927GTG0_9BACL|nr:DNA repair protein RecN [Paenibacillus sabuli]MBD2847306.1 DNA repair protein RecN [Paenibacillus sabuli]
MLRELSVRNLAVIEKATVNFHRGFHVLTGETGAGKSILIDALGLLAGGRGASDMVRHGCDKAEIEAVFDLSINHPVWQCLESNGIQVDPEELLIIRRDIYAHGKGISRINGQAANLAILREAGEHLINIHGQHEHQSLQKTERHLEWLDLYAGEPLAERKAAYREAYEAYQRVTAERKEFEENARQNMQMLDLYRFQIEEIRSADLKPEEEQELEEEKHFLAHADRRMKGAADTYDLLQDGGGLDALRGAATKLQELQAYDDGIGALYEQVQSAYYQAEDAAFQLRDYLEDIEANPQRLDFIEQRLDLLHGLKRKYGETIPDILKYVTKISIDADRLENHEEHLQLLREEQKRLLAHASQLAGELSNIRKHAAKQLSAAIVKELKQLKMDKTLFEVQLFQHPSNKSEAKYRLGPQGMDEALFAIAPNPGEPLKPLSKIASGGEMSRVMLALKAIFARHDQIPVLIFDEVDTGVSGRAAQAIAEKLSRLAAHCQVFAITHLPQVACMSDHHYEIRKRISAGRTVTSVLELMPIKRIEELARMLGGVEVTEKTRHHAQEMLDLAKRQKGA